MTFDNDRVRFRVPIAAKIAVREEQAAFSSSVTPRPAPRAEVIAYGQAAADDLARLITDAVRSSDDAQVEELDRVLRKVEQIVDLARYAPSPSCHE